ncbi:MAG: TolC family protein [Aliidongia sp.]
MNLNHLFSGNATTWSFAPQLTIPIFTGGQNEANLDLAKVQKNIQVAQYEKAIQTAFREVSDALASRGHLWRPGQGAARSGGSDPGQFQPVGDAVQSRGRQLSAGADAERSLYTAQQTLLSLKQAQLTQQATLYKALGGGWIERTGQKPPAENRKPTRGSSAGGSEQPFSCLERVKILQRAPILSGAGVPARLPATSRHSLSRERGLPAHAGKAGGDARPTEEQSPHRYFHTLMRESAHESAALRLRKEATAPSASKGGERQRAG